MSHYYSDTDGYTVPTDLFLDKALDALKSLNDYYKEEHVVVKAYTVCDRKGYDELGGISTESRNRSYSQGGNDDYVLDIRLRIPGYELSEELNVVYDDVEVYEAEKKEAARLAAIESLEAEKAALEAAQVKLDEKLAKLKS